MDPALIGSIFAGITGLATVITGYLINRQKVRTDLVSADVGQVEAELADLRDRFEIALAHIYELRAAMGAHELHVPELPDELTLRRRRKTG
ncbi:hypothetical protein SAMN02982929_05294 [Saccharopolyspora kobensis]|uniref:Uncharacterized protein n=1 Tax=Saccharopolyspora kobensis TaxID=146035 RepID=A0A1H6E115_9PSEU|nr:hypothetical protein [Saccharopolyspora kobensis]SEG90696.1 hypothetical protein SAMN02982929_05294 [Saccharopolyspora kobensis]SFD93265.1 hypothetical protein SAMN05216506_107270 [Saccharopolyspora kobensis]